MILKFAYPHMEDHHDNNLATVILPVTQTLTFTEDVCHLLQISWSISKRI